MYRYVVPSTLQHLYCRRDHNNNKCYSTSVALVLGDIPRELIVFVLWRAPLFPAPAPTPAPALSCPFFVFEQIWMRCFAPVDVKHRGKLWGALAPSALDGLDFAAGRWHRQLVCGLVTLFAQVTKTKRSGKRSGTLGKQKRSAQRNVAKRSG